MEDIDALLPRHVKQKLLAACTMDAICSVCHEVDTFLSRSTVLIERMKELVDSTGPNSKSLKEALRLKAAANNDFKQSRFESASKIYSEALCLCPFLTPSDKKEASRMYSNRSACFQRLGKFDSALRDCSRSAQLDPTFSKPWFRKGSIYLDLKKVSAAKENFTEALHLESQFGTPSGRSQVLKELSKMSCTADVVSEDELQEALSAEENVQGSNRVLLLDLAEDDVKGRGLRAAINVPAGAVVLAEAPFVAILGKAHRKLRCHFCFMELFPDVVPCNGCASAKYCSEACRDSASCQSSTQPGVSWGEHSHECGGASWPSVLPEQCVLVGRLLARIVRQSWLHPPNFTELGSGRPVEACDWSELDDLSKVLSLQGHLEKWSSDLRMERFRMAVVLAHCMRASWRTAGGSADVHLFSTWASLAAMSILHINSMAVKTNPLQGHRQQGDGSPEGQLLQEVTVGSGLYPSGSFLNHSCMPKGFCSFEGRQLLVRSVQDAAQGEEIEISYGPQVGELTGQERKESLLACWHFICQCQVCSSPATSEVEMRALRCPARGCEGAMAAPGPHSALSAQLWQCLQCREVANVTALRTVAERAMAELSRIQDLERGEQVLRLLESVLHRHNIKLGEAHDMVARILVEDGQVDRSVQHIRTSLHILSKYYPADSIVLAMERWKLVRLATVANVGAQELGSTMQSVNDIFSRHYGRTLPC